jgi:hypothetical protein
MMKKIILIMAILATFSSAVFSEEEYTLSEAPQEDVLSILESCKEIASADDVDSTMLTDFLLTCVNDDLDLFGFQSIQTLPAE